MTAADGAPDPPVQRSEASRRRRGARAIAAEQQRRQTTFKAIGAAIGLVALVAVVWFAVNTWQQRNPAAPSDVQSFSDLPVGHSAEPQTYGQTPPVGGVHDPVWQNCGFYPAPVRNENAVHSLEHGAVWITYRPDLPEDQIETLRALAQEQSFILVSALEGIPAPVVASAWGKQVQLESADDERLGQFIRSYRLSQDAPEPGAACTGGTTAVV